MKIHYDSCSWWHHVDVVCSWKKNPHWTWENKSAIHLPQEHFSEPPLLFHNSCTVNVTLSMTGCWVCNKFALCQWLSLCLWKTEILYLIALIINNDEFIIHRSNVPVHMRYISTAFLITTTTLLVTISLSWFNVAGHCAEKNKKRFSWMRWRGPNYISPQC